MSAIYKYKEESCLLRSSSPKGFEDALIVRVKSEPWPFEDKATLG